MKTILVTGSKGFIGSHLVPQLKKSHKVVEWDIKDKRDIFASSFEGALKRADAVVHLAAETSVTQSFDKEAEYVKLNVLGTARVLELCVKYGKKLVFPSTGAYYHRELSPYASTKALADDLCQAVQAFHPVTILRFFNVYGTNMNDRTGSIIYNFAKAAAQNKNIIVYGSGEQTRDFISVKDVVQIVEAALSSRWDGKIVDVGTGKLHTINYVAELFAHFVFGKIVYHKAPKREIKWSVADTRILRMLYKRKFVTKLHRDISDIVKYYKERV